MERSLLLPRRRILAAGCRTIGALTMGGAGGMLIDGCAHVPTSSTSTSTTLMHVNFMVSGEIQPYGSTSPYYYFAVINLTSNASDPGPLPIRAAPWGNGIAGPPATAASNSQTFVSFIQYDSSQGQYQAWLCPTTGSGTSAAFVPAVDVSSPSGFSSIGLPDQYTIPASGSSTFDAVIDLNRLKANSSDTLPAYAQVNFIMYSYLATGSYNGSRYSDAIGDGTVYATIATAQSGQIVSSSTVSEPSGGVENSSGQIVTSATDAVIPNLQITSWYVRML